MLEQNIQSVVNCSLTAPSSGTCSLLPHLGLGVHGRAVLLLASLSPGPDRPCGFQTLLLLIFARTTGVFWRPLVGIALCLTVLDHCVLAGQLRIGHRRVLREMVGRRLFSRW